MDTESKLRLEDIPVVNFGQFLLDKLRLYGDAVALIDAVTDESFTYAELATRAKRVAAGLQNAVSVGRNDVVSILSTNHVDYLTSFYASCLISAIFQPLNPLYTTDDIKRTFSEIRTNVLITIPVFLPKIKQALGDKDIKILLLSGEAEGCRSFQTLLDPAHGSFVTYECDWKTTDAVYFSSSGTTGFPKTVRTSHYNLVANVVIAEPFVTVGEGDTYVVYLPLYHIYGLFTLTSHAHTRGVRIVMMAKFNMEDYLTNVQKYKSRILQTVPPVLVGLAKYPHLTKYDLSFVTSIMSGAAPLKQDTIDVVKSRIPTAEIYQGYGMTELGLTHANFKDRWKQNTVGKVLPFVELKIIDVDTGKTLGPGQEGEIWIRGPTTSSGYVNRPDETAEMFLPDGWVKTGDIGREDEEHYLTIVDRLKDLIKYKGFQVAPASLEGILLTHDAIADACVVGVPDDEAGELPRAYILKKPGKEANEKEIIEFIAERVAPHMELRGGVKFVSDIPRTQSGKILRKIFRHKAKELVK